MRSLCMLQIFEFAVLASSVAFAPPADTAKNGGVVFPEVVVPSDNKPKPAPVVAVPKLAADQLYVVASETPFLLIDSPPGKVQVTREAGPIRIRGKFLDGNGKVETRTYSAKHIAIIEAVGVGRVELIAFPEGAKTEKDVIRAQLDADGGAVPNPDEIPAPKPKPPDVDPNPAPKPQPVIDGPLWIVTVTQSERRTPTEEALLNDDQFWKGVEKAGHSVRHYDADEASAKAAGYADVYANLGSCLVIVKPKGDKGEVVKKIKLPPLTTDVAAVIKELTGK